MLFVTDGVDEAKIFIGINTIGAWGILPKDFLKSYLSAFYASNDVMKKVKVKITCSPRYNLPNPSSTKIHTNKQTNKQT